MQSDFQLKLIMKLTKKNKSFEPAPEYSGPAICIDVTSPKTVETAFGPKEQFKLIFEIGSLREDGTPFCVWSRGFVPSLHEKAALAQFLRKWFGRSLTAAEEAEFDTEDLVGKTAEITVVHEEGRNGEVYANIALIRPDRSGKPLTQSGKFIRMKDRPAKDAEFHRTEPAPKEDSDWRRVKVHVGRHSGLDLGDLNRASVQALIERWLPETKAKEKTTADDRRLIAALESADAELRGDDDVPMNNQPY